MCRFSDGRRARAARGASIVYDEPVAYYRHFAVAHPLGALPFDPVGRSLYAGHHHPRSIRQGPL